VPLEAYYTKNALNGFDAGLLFEPFFVKWANINAYLGFRSTGVGIGFDLTKNMDLYLGYSVAWLTWRSNPYVGFGFALW
jgi:hypothetical protein